jgi:2-polyprenyl-3-methyl-5-hydroxy-6-metoxy-1,4-benzoquinol methylase
MDSKIKFSVKCLFCHGNMRLQYQNVFHPFKPDHGPFDIYLCQGCHSCQTDPLPSPDSLASLYRFYDDGLPDLHRKITTDDPQTALYQKCITRICYLSNRKAQDKFTWLEVGGGGGEFAALMAKQFPYSHGLVIDLHPRPAALTHVSTVEWKQIDITQEIFSDELSQFDLIASIAVLEHVLRPDLFISNLLQLLRPGGMLYLLCPNNASWASKILRNRWPYFTPGEHLAMPTPSGAVHCLQREWRLLGRSNNQVSIQAKALMLPYTLRYVMRRLGADKIGRVLPRGWGFSLPSGVLESTVIW